MNPKARKGLRTWIEVDKEAIRHNYNSLRKIIPKKVKVMSIVKSNAYGHNLVDFSKEMQKFGVDFFGVDSIVEAITLRKSGIKKPILVLGYTLPEMLIKAVKNDVIITVSTFELLDAISKTKFSKKIKVHIKADTGMHRQGFQEYEIDKVIQKLKGMESKIDVCGLYTHFAGIKNEKLGKATLKQFQSFKKWVEKFKKENFNFIAHAGASSAALIFPEAYFDMVRFGMAQHGLWPSDDVKKISNGKVDLKPILQWKTIIGEVKKVPKGDSVGYDFLETFKKDSTIAICPVGYWHGYPRNLSIIGHVLVRGKRARVLGRISMDMITIDISNIKGVKVGDIVTLIGTDVKETISAEDVANWAETSPYEIITRTNPLIKKIYF